MRSNGLVLISLCYSIMLLSTTTQQTRAYVGIIMSALESSSCPVGFYLATAAAANISEQGSGACAPCSECAPGFGVLAECSGHNNTLCKGCGDGTFSFLSESSSQRVCKPCKECGPSRTEVTQCSIYRNSVCGLCEREYFLFVSSTGEQKCLPCSPCPDDFVATHYFECDQAGLPVDQQCYPSYENGTEVPTTKSDVVTTEQTTTGSTFWLDKGGFISQSTFAIITVVKPLPPAVGISIVTVFVALTVLAIVFFVLGSWCFLRDKCFSCARNTSRTQMHQTCRNCCCSQRKWLCCNCQKMSVESPTCEEMVLFSTSDEHCDASSSSLSESIDSS